MTALSGIFISRTDRRVSEMCDVTIDFVLIGPEAVFSVYLPECYWRWRARRSVRVSVVSFGHVWLECVCVCRVRGAVYHMKIFTFLVRCVVVEGCGFESCV